MNVFCIYNNKNFKISAELCVTIYVQLKRNIKEFKILIKVKHITTEGLDYLFNLFWVEIK